MRGAVIVLCFVGCLTARPPRGEVVLAVDETRIGGFGLNGPNGVAQAQLDVQARVVDTFPAEIFYPVDRDEAALQQNVLVVMIQERNVAAERYFWLAQHLASRGYATAVVDHFADAPLAEIDNGWLALDAVRRVSRLNGALKNLLTDDATAVVIGHGDGGKAAQDLWMRYADIPKLVAIGSALSQDIAKKDGVALCLTGGNDRYKDAMLRACDSFPFATTRVIEGANHYVFADNVLQSESSMDEPLTEDAQAVRSALLVVLDAWLDATVKDDPDAKRLLAGER